MIVLQQQKCSKVSLWFEAEAEILDPRKENLNYDGTRALDGGDGAFRSGIKDGGKAKKIRCPPSNFTLGELLVASKSSIFS